MLDFNLPVHSFSKKSLLLFLVGALFILLITSIILLPKAEIDLKLKKESLIQDFKLIVSEDSPESLVSLGIIKGYIKSSGKDYIFLPDLKSNGRFLSFSKKDQNDFVRYELEQILGDQKEILDFHKLEVDYQVTDFDETSGRAEIVLSIKSDLTPKIALAKIQRDLKGRSKKYALGYLKNLPNISDFSLKIKPFWISTMPIWEKRINIGFDLF